jgi:type IV pilus assembly protein PilW
MHPTAHRPAKLGHQQAGFGVAEFMVAMTIGLVVLTGLSSVYMTANRSSRELQGNSEQIENGRFALDLLASDLRHAGYYGQLTTAPALPAALPDPCESADLAALTQAMALPVQGYDAPAGSPLACLDGADLVPGTDILVVRRAHSEALAPTDVPEDGVIYLQANTTQAELQLGKADGAIGTTRTADGRDATILRKDGVTAAGIQRYLVHIYFIAPCAIPKGGGDRCTGADDDGGRPVPTLKRLELAAAAGATTLRIVPLVAGIENMQVDYGVDEWPAAMDTLTGLAGDGAPDCEDTDPGAAGNPAVTAGCPSGNPGGTAGWGNAVQVKVHLLARNTAQTVGHIEDKTYTLGLGTTIDRPAGAFKRHVYASAVRLNNQSGRREIPQ